MFSRIPFHCFARWFRFAFVPSPGWWGLWRWRKRFKTEVSECQALPAKRAEGFLRRLFSPNAVETARNKRKHWLEGLYA